MRTPSLYVGSMEQSFADEVENTVLSRDFLWSLKDRTVPAVTHKDDNTVDSMQLTHSIILDGKITSPVYAPLVSVFTHLLSRSVGVSLTAPYRAKANLNVQNASMGDAHYPAHHDLETSDGKCSLPFVTCVYYVNDCDGDTIFSRMLCKSPIECPPRKGSLCCSTVTCCIAGARLG